PTPSARAFAASPLGVATGDYPFSLWLCAGAALFLRRLGPHPQALSLAPSRSLGLKAASARAFAASPLGVATGDYPFSLWLCAGPHPRAPTAARSFARGAG